MLKLLKYHTGCFAIITPLINPMLTIFGHLLEALGKLTPLACNCAIRRRTLSHFSCASKFPILISFCSLCEEIICLCIFRSAAVCAKIHSVCCLKLSHTPSRYVLLLYQFKLCNSYWKKWAIPRSARIPDPMCLLSVKKSENFLKMRVSGCTTFQQNVFLIQTNRPRQFSQCLDASIVFFWVYDGCWPVHINSTLL